MDLVWDVVDQGRRATVDLLHGHEIDHSAPFSPDVPEDLRNWLPDLFDRFPIILPWEKPKPVDPALHNVWILENTAFRTPASGDHRPELAELQDANAAKPKMASEPGQTTQSVQPGSGGWEVEFVAAYFIKNSGKGLAHATASLVKQLNVDDHDEATKKRISARLEAFIDSVLPNRTVRISIDNKEEQTLGPSSYSGLSSGLLQLHFPPSAPQIQSNALTLPPPFGLPSTTVFAEEQGWGIISDIDDTIKVTQSTSPIGILKTTFTVETPQPITGMPELYVHIQRTLTLQPSTNTNTSTTQQPNPPPFFYLSASPYNLYPFLLHFRNTHYPPGTIILRDASWQNLGGLIASLQQNTQAYKADRMTKIHSWLPHRKFVCLGDSTQSDPEAYGEMARKYPGWIRAVFIRKVVGIAGMDERVKNAAGRFERAFEGLERGLWHVFTEPGELAGRVDELARDGEAMVGGE
ncbi:hypothetical protein B0A55_04759 [Friedmanniomyces simplex]|uniref:Phosphatidate phosphatase APP1 catalytic domain-containing protein n=1 Tax=Friedmanniomyces simplex TaxID=329884 RepID=A0A4U0XJY4_9PEZI|nr:hypothetical protein B0A55_04759 [Friedmanniomyces simplex]